MIPTTMPETATLVRPDGQVRRQPLRLGIIGCGYVTRMSHLPSAQQMPDRVKVVALADTDLARAQQLAEEFGVGTVVADYQQMLELVDAVIVAVPHHLHATMTIQALQAGRHVLCEKPMAMSTAECDAMQAAAERNGRVLAVGQMRHFYPAARLMRQAIKHGWLGRPLSFEAEEAVLFENFAAGLFAVKGPSAGVLWDTGPHALDLLAWWFPGLRITGYADDSRGGPEANAEARLCADGDIAGRMHLSRTRRLGNMVRVIFEEGSLTFPTTAQTGVRLETNGQAYQPALISFESSGSPFAAQLADFAGACLEHRPPAVDGATGRTVVALIEQCLALRQPLPPQPWEELMLLKIGETSND